MSPMQPQRYFLVCHICGELLWDNEVKKLHPRKFFYYYKEDFGKTVKIEKRSFKCPKCKHDSSSSIYTNRLKITEVKNERDGRSFLELVQSAITVPISHSDYIKITSALIRGDRDRHPNESITRTFWEVRHLEIKLRGYKRGSGPIKDLNNDPIIKETIQKFNCD